MEINTGIDNTGAIKELEYLINKFKRSDVSVAELNRNTTPFKSYSNDLSGQDLVGERITVEIDLYYLK